MGLIGNVLAPAYWGRTISLMPPAMMLRKPAAWLRAISTLRATCNGGPNFGYDLCVDRITPDEARDLDLSCWRIAYSGGEPVAARTLARFAARFAPNGFDPAAFLPCYGLAEATLFVAGRASERAPTILRVDREQLERGRLVEVDTIGVESAGIPDGSAGSDGDDGAEGNAALLVGHRLPQSAARIDVRIMTAGGELLDEGALGDVCVDSDSVARGYWNDTRLDEVGGYLRTGDVGFVKDGELFVIGRSKDVIIIRGRNVYPQDIEQAMAALHPALAGGGVAFAAPTAQGEGLVIVQGARARRANPLDVDEVRRSAQRMLATQFALKAHDIVFVAPPRIARTTSGKVRRRAMREAYLTNRLERIDADAVAPLAPEPTQASRFSQAQAEESRATADALRRWLRDYAERRLDLRTMDERRAMAPHVVLDFARRGLLGLEAPREWNGLGLTATDALRIVEQLAAIDLSLAAFVGVQNALGVGPLWRFGTDAQRRQWLGDAASGRLLVAFALTEAGAGSNPRALQTTARQTPDGSWELTGDKIWIGTAAWSGLLIVFAKAEAANGVRGITAFLVPTDAPGVVNAEEAPTLGMRSMIQNRICFQRVRVPSESVLGEVGHGMTIAQATMSLGRLGIAAMSLGATRRAMQIMTAYASTRRIATGLLIDHPVTTQRLFDSACAARAIDALLMRIASELDAGSDATEDVLALCKLTSTELLGESADHLIQVTGGRGYIESSGVPQLFRDARLLRIFEGPSETLAWFVGTRLIQDAEPLVRILSERWRGPHGGRRLADAMRAIRAAVDAAPDDARLRNLRAFQAGQLAGWCALESALEGSSTRPDGVNALEWVRARASACARQAEDLPEAGWRCPAATLVAEAARHEADLGRALAVPAKIEVESLLMRVADGSSPPRVPRETMPRQAKGVAPPVSIDPEKLRRKLIALVARRARLAEDRVNVQTMFTDYGLDSMDAVELSEMLGEWLGTPIDPSLFLEFSTIEALAAHLSGAPAARVVAMVGERQPHQTGEGI
jgi:alkylation response protein AidB-like acyl-CoA dehydrogenase/acyl carrier protein